MRVLALGATGEYGKVTAKLLAPSDLVSEILIAGRNQETAKACAKEIGEKARAVSIDLFDENRLIALAKDADLLVNTAGPEFEVALKTLRAAITAGTNYCDLCADGPTMESALEMDSAARAKNVTALMGIGLFPGLSNLLMVHAIRQLDVAEKVHFCLFCSAAALEDSKERVRNYRQTGRVGAAWQMIMKWATPPFHIYKDGKLTAVESSAEENSITMPGNGNIPAVSAGGTEMITIPRVVSGLRDVRVYWGWFPFSLNRRYIELGRQVKEGALTLSQAALTLLDSVAEEIDGGQKVPPDFLGDFAVWAEASGMKDGRRVKYRCSPMGWASTATPLALASLKILSGEITTRGVLAPEDWSGSATFLQ